MDVDLSKPLRKGEELLPTIKAYERKSRYAQRQREGEGRGKGERRREKRERG